jgi:transposase
VARDRTALAEALRDRPAARVADARDRQRHLLCYASGLPVAVVTERPAAMGNDLPLVHRLARRRINLALVMADRERVGRDASPSAAIIDSQSVKTTEAGGARGYDAGKKINGRKRHALVDTDGRGLVLEPHPASVQDRDGGGALLNLSRRSFPFIERVFADSGYAGEKVAKATLIAVEIVRKNPDQVGFAANPRCWVVERFFAWIGRNRRLARDFEATIDSARAFLYAASVMLLVRRIARGS